MVRVQICVIWELQVGLTLCLVLGHAVKKLKVRLGEGKNYEGKGL